MMSRFASSASNRDVQARSLRRARAGGVALAAGALTMVWAGCGSGPENRYYCDSSGCFECDAYGCASVSAPAHKPCTGTTSCDPGSVCTDKGCTQTCSEGVPCAKGEVCKSGLCAAPTDDVGGKKECETRADCPGGTCTSGSCKACGGSAGPCPCATSADCTSDQVCTGGGVCTAKANACKFSSECASDKICADGQCLTSCEGACATGFQCDKGVCVAQSGGCENDGQCSGETSRCAAGTCVKPCATDPECGDGKFCDQSACVIDTRPKPNCTSDAQCGGTPSTPKKCIAGFCKFTCTTGGDAYCRTIDNRIGVCAKDLVCRSAAEANAECVAREDCAGGKECIDNRCR